MKDGFEKSEFIDTLYEFSGKWGVGSLCGLRVVKGKRRHIVIATNLYDRNPGTSVTDYCPELAALVCGDYGLDQEKVLFIEHCPDRGSKLDNYGERFDRVDLRREGGRFTDPDWNELTLDEVRKMMKEEQHGGNE